MANNSARANGAALPRPPRGLADLIDPIPAATFERDYWEKRELILHRADPGRYRGLLTLADVDEILSTTSLRAPELMVISASRRAPAGGQREPGVTDSRRGVET